MGDCVAVDPYLSAENKVAAAIASDGNIDETWFGSAMGGRHGAIQPLRFCHWVTSEVTGQGSLLWTYIFQAAQLAVAALGASIQGQIADLKEDLAESYYDMAKDKWERFKNAYVPLEISLIHEVDNVDEPEMDCDDDRSRAEAAVNSSYDYIDKLISQKAKMYRMCLDDTDVAQLNYGRSLMLVDTENYNLIDDQWYVDYKSDQRWSRRSQVLNLGRNLSSVALEYGDMSRSLLNGVGDFVDKALGSLSYALGYYGSKFDTYYPNLYLASSSGANVSLDNGVSYTGTA